MPASPSSDKGQITVMCFTGKNLKVSQLKPGRTVCVSQMNTDDQPTHEEYLFNTYHQRTVTGNCSEMPSSQLQWLPPKGKPKTNILVCILWGKGRILTHDW